MGELFSCPQSGWTTTDDYADSGKQYCIGNQQALNLAGEIARYLAQPKMWASEAEPQAVAGADKAHFRGNFHGHASTLRGLLEYATATNDPDGFLLTAYGVTAVRRMPRGERRRGTWDWFDGGPASIRRGCGARRGDTLYKKGLSHHERASCKRRHNQTV